MHTFAVVNETRSSSGEPLSHEVILTLLQEPLSHGAQTNLIMKINLILMANVEWHKNDDSKPKEMNGHLSLIAALLNIIASLLNIFCH